MLAVHNLIAIPPLAHRVDPADEAGSLSVSWWLGHARPNQEVRLADKLLASDVPHWLPVARYDRVAPSGRRRSTVRGLFDSYVFLAGDEFDRLNALSTGLLVSAIPVSDVPGLIADLRQLDAVLRAGEPIGPARVLAPGDRVRVASGVFEGREGTLIRLAGRDCLQIEVACLGRAVLVEVEEWRVERIGDA